MPTGACRQNEPLPAEGAQAWMSVTNPQPGAETTLCVRLIVSGQAVVGATVSAVATYSTTTTILGPATTGADGVAAIRIGTAAQSAAVRVDVTVQHAGQTYRTNTSFTPR